MVEDPFRLTASPEDMEAATVWAEDDRTLGCSLVVELSLPLNLIGPVILTAEDEDLQIRQADAPILLCHDPCIRPI